MISDAYKTAVAVANNIKWIHWNVYAGADFDAVHDLAGAYYDHLQDDIDSLAELALEFHDPIINPSLVQTDIPVETKPSYTYNEAMEAILCNLHALVDSLRGVTDHDLVATSDTTHEIKGMVRYWSKELSYKGVRRLAENNASVEPAQVDDLQDVPDTTGLELVEPDSSDDIIEL